MDLENRGIPGGFIASSAFIEAADAQGKALGFHPAKVFVPHPIQDRTDSEIRVLAENSVEDILAMVSCSKAQMDT